MTKQLFHMIFAIALFAAGLVLPAGVSIAHPGHEHIITSSPNESDEVAVETDIDEAKAAEDPIAAVTPDGATVLEKPMRVMFQYISEKQQLKRTNGQLFAHNDEGFTFDDGAGAHWQPWSPVVAKDYYLINFRLHKKADAATWVKIGAALSTKKDGENYSKLAFKRAKKIDPELTDDTIKAAVEKAEAAAEQADASEQPGERPANAKGDGQPAGNAQAGMQGPRVMGQIDRSTWGELTVEQMAKAVERHKAWSNKALERTGVELGLLETKYFLFYTDLSNAEAKQWGSLLDRMHERLLKMFGLPAGKNIWYGKGCIYVFTKEANYHEFLRTNFRINSTGSAGMCISHGNGDVHIAFYRQPDKWAFAGILVHEAVHGFIHRYRSPARIDSWLNEGMAKIISQQLVPQYNWVDRRRAMAKKQLSKAHNFGGMFELGHITGEQYGMAAELTDFMVSQDRKRFVNFFNGIKDGLTWRESMAKHYAPLEKVVTGYGLTVGNKSLKP